MNFQILSILSILLILFGCAEHSNKKGINDELLTIEEQIYYYPHLIEGQVDSLKVLMSKDTTHLQVGQVAFLCGFMEYHKGNMDSSICFLEKSVLTYTRKNDVMGQAKCYLLLGWIAEGAGFWEQAKANYYKTIQLTGDINIKENGLAWLGIARCKQILKEPQHDDAGKGITYLKSTGKKVFSLYADFSAFMFGEQNETAAEQLKTVALEYLDLGLGNKGASTYKLLARYYLHQGQLDSAQSQIDKAITNYDGRYKRSCLLPGLYQMKGVIYFFQKDYESSRQYLVKSVEKYHKQGRENLAYYGYKYLMRLDTLQGSYRQAVYHQTKAFHCYQEMQKKEKQLMARVAEVDMNVLSLQQTIEQLVYRSLVSHIVYGCLIVLVLVAGFIFFQLMRQKYQKKQHRARERSLQLQNLLVGLGEKRLLDQSAASEIDQGQEGDWRSGPLQDEFKECYLETIRLFAKDFPQLSETEVRYAVMFALDLSAEIIAELQNVQIATIRKVKQRIRQKVDCQEIDSLEQFFQNYQKTNILASAAF